MQKLAELEATAPKVTKKKLLTEGSVSSPGKSSFKDIVNVALAENVMPGQKPLPVLDPQNKQAGMGFVTSNNPSVQNMLKNLDPKDVQITQAPGQQPQQNQQPPQQQNQQMGQQQNQQQQNQQQQNQQQQNQQQQNQQMVKEAPAALKTITTYLNNMDSELEVEYEFDEDGDIEIIGVRNSFDSEPDGDDLLPILSSSELYDLREKVQQHLEDEGDDYGDYQHELRRDRELDEGKKVDLASKKAAPKVRTSKKKNLEEAGLSSLVVDKATSIMAARKVKKLLTTIGYTFLGTRSSLGKTYDIYQNSTTGDEIKLSRIDSETGMIEYISSLKGDGEIEYENIGQLKQLLVPDKLKDVLAARPNQNTLPSNIHPGWKDFLKPGNETSTTNHMAAGLFLIYKGAYVPTEPQVKAFWNQHTGLGRKILLTYDYHAVMEQYLRLASGKPPVNFVGQEITKGDTGDSLANAADGVIADVVRSKIHDMLIEYGFRLIAYSGKNVTRYTNYDIDMDFLYSVHGESGTVTYSFDGASTRTFKFKDLDQHLSEIEDRISQAEDQYYMDMDDEEGIISDEEWIHNDYEEPRYRSNKNK